MFRRFCAVEQSLGDRQEDFAMSVDQQEQQDEICPSCRKAIRKRSKGSFTAWIFQDSICRCVPGADSIEEAVVAASVEVPAQSAGNARKRSLLGASTPVVVTQAEQSELLQQPGAQPTVQYPLHPTAQNTAQPTGQQSVQHAPLHAPLHAPQPTPQLTPQSAPQPIPQPRPQSVAQPAPQRVTQNSSQSPARVVEAQKPGLITFRDLVAASVAAVLLYVGLKVSGNNEQVVLGLVGSIVVVTLVVLGIRFVRK